MLLLRGRTPRVRLTVARPQALGVRWAGSTSGDQERRTVEIGGVVAPVKDAKALGLVPRGYLPPFTDSRPMSQELLGHLRWMLQKDLLSQDMFLIGPPGASRRLLSMRFCELLNKEVEYVAISPDTTESDLKQRREIVNGAAIFTDQAPVRAAINGRVLVIDGLEKAERNVLPTLNNLLENREMSLDDGRFLMKAESYDALLEAGYSRRDLDAQNLVRVHPDFRVIALGLPVPPYPGRTLDPPLRSRFQARNVRSPSPGTQLEALVNISPTVPIPVLERLVGIREAVNVIEATTQATGSSGQQRMPHFNYLSMAHCAQVLDKFPDASIGHTVRRVFPVIPEVFGVKAASNCSTLDRVLDKFASDKSTPSSQYIIEQVTKQSPSDSIATAKFRVVSLNGSGGDTKELQLPCGASATHNGPMRGFYETSQLRSILSDMIQDHAAGSDLCVLGAKGSGKSDLVRLFAHRLGYPTELFSLFKDMTARDLLQRRATDSRGNTRWEDSPLIHAARRGHIAILDGVHRLGSDSLGVLQRLIQDREIDLADGTKLLSKEKYDAVIQEEDVDAEDVEGSATLSTSRIFPIHPSFRIIAIAEADPYSLKSSTTVPGKEPTSAWLNSESIAMFSFHHLHELSGKECQEIVGYLYPDLPAKTSQALLSFAEKLRDTKEHSSEPDYLALTMSLRQLLRVCRRLNAFPSQSMDDLRLVLHDTLLTQFLPPSCSRLVDSLLDASDVPVQRKASSAIPTDLTSPSDEIRQENGQLFIGNISYPLQNPSNPELVPQPHFFDIPKHTATMKDMLQDVASGQKHLLLIGNQGVGKNKVVDRLLQLLQQEREYIQLHRDTTVQTLTLVPTLVDGKIVWEDSPLVRAAKTGRTLVVDEADKAPLEVVCVLKGLIEDGEMLLGNGKRLIDSTKVSLDDYEKDQVIPLHSNFQVWVLANRPGFPFHGNNFFREIGDIFASHAIDNPDEESELELLRAYAPTVPTEILRRLCRAFAELRELVEQGVITYPYSTREAVAVAKHLEKFPTDGITSVLENVLAFDAYDSNMRQQLSEVFLSHGIPLTASGEDFQVGITLATPKKLPPVRETEMWHWDANSMVRLSFNGNKKGRKKDSASHLFLAELKRRQIWLDPPTKQSFAVQQHRLQHFTEQLASFRAPVTASREQAAHALAVFPDDSVHVLTRSPMSLHSFSNIETGSARAHRVLELESQYMRWETSPALVNLVHQQELAVFIPSTGLTIFIDPHQNSDGRARCFSLPDGALDGQVHQPTGSPSKAHPFAKWFSSGGASPSSPWQLVANSSGDDGLLVRFQLGGSIFQLIDFQFNRFYSMDLGSQNLQSSLVEELTDVQHLGNDEWLLRTTNKSAVHSIQRVDETEFLFKRATVGSLSAADTQSSLFAGHSFSIHRDAFLQEISSEDGRVKSRLREPADAREGMLRAWSNDECVVNTSVSPDGSIVDLELTSPLDQSTRTVVVDARRSADTSESMPRVVGVAKFHNNGQHTITLHEDGNVRIWQFDQTALEADLKLWKQLVGFSDPVEPHDRSGALELKLNGQSPESKPRTGLDAPKYGKEDPKNDPHVGGNTWAGGSGGSDTAGLGGRGGPYRLDKGHPVHQVSQEKKDEVSAATRAKARAMAEEALAARLEEINMSDQEWATYQRYVDRVEPEISQMRAILGNLESVEQERSWLKHQSSGELDDSKLVDGVAGERLVFKRRGQSDSPFSSRAQSHLPKRLLFVMDVSGSMYRFNGQDGRLERMLETSLMVMESFAGFDKTLEYSIVGHSGDSPDIPFVAFGDPPADRKQRLKVLQKMAAHTQYCASGDHTVEAVARAVKRVVEQDADDFYVLVVSDANLNRYGIRPARIGELLSSDPRVKAHAIFIASLADEAERIQRQLPSGRGHVCLDTAALPRTFQQIFSAAFRG